MLQLDPYKQIQLTRLVADYTRTSRSERAIADTLKEADFARSAALATPPSRPARRLGWRALVGRLARRTPAPA